MTTDAPDDSTRNWIDRLSAADRKDVVGHLSKMIELRLAMSAKESVVPFEVAFRDSFDPALAVDTLRELAASVRRQEERSCSIREHIEAVTSIVSTHFGF